MRQFQDPLSAIRWLPAANTGGAQVPAWGLCAVTGADKYGVLQVGQPTVDSQDVVVNGPVPIPPGGKGQVTNDFPWLALYESGDGTPGLNEEWGAGAGSWKLRKGNSGFRVRGGSVGPDGAGNLRVFISRMSTLTVRNRSGSVTIRDVNTLILADDDDWVLTSPQPGVAQVTPNGLSGQYVWANGFSCDSNGNPVASCAIATFKDGLLKAVRSGCS